MFDGADVGDAGEADGLGGAEDEIAFFATAFDALNVADEGVGLDGAFSGGGDDEDSFAGDGVDGAARTTGGAEGDVEQEQAEQEEQEGKTEVDQGNQGAIGLSELVGGDEKPDDEDKPQEDKEQPGDGDEEDGAVFPEHAPGIGLA